MRKIYRSKIALMLATVVLTGMMTVPVLGAEEMETPAEGEYATEESFEGDFISEDAVPQEYSDESFNEGAGQVIPAVPTPDGKMVASSFPDNLVPLMFHKVTASYQGSNVEAAQFDNGNVLLLYVTDSAGNDGVFKEYNEGTGELTDFLMIAGAGESFIVVLPLDPGTSAPEGFEEVIVDWNGLSLSAYVNTSAEASLESDASPSDYLLLYAVSSSGRQGWYLYDQVEATYQRYLNIAGSSAKSEGGVFDFQGIKDGNSDAIVRIIIFGAMALLIIILIILAIILGVKLKEYSGYDYIDEEEYNAIAGTTSNGNVPQTMQQTVNRRPVQRERADEEKPQREVKEAVAAKPVQPRENKPHRENPQAQSRRNLLETGDIADLDDILNDPNSTSNLPMPSEIDREIARTRRRPVEEHADAEQAQDNGDDNYEEMQVTVDRFAAGMPAMVDTEMIADNLEGSDAEEAIEDEEETAVSNEAVDENVEDGSEGELPGENFDEYVQADPYNNGYDQDDLYEDDYYLTKEERRERKALEKQRRREEKEAEKDAKYLEKERRRAEKSRKYGYDEATPMDWTAFGDAMREESTSADNRRPVGNNEEKLPSYMKKSSQTAKTKESPKKPQLSEEEKANAAADAVIAAARGENRKSEREYREYRQNSRNQYEDFRRRDEQIAREQREQEQAQAQQPVEKPEARQPQQGRVRQAPQQPMARQPQQGQARQSQQPMARQPQQGQAVRQAPQQPVSGPSFSEDFDEDFEFEFLNIRHPQ